VCSAVWSSREVSENGDTSPNVFLTETVWKLETEAELIVMSLCDTLPPPTAIRKSLKGDIGPGYRKLKRSIFHEFYRHLDPNNSNVFIEIKRVFFPI
jgi:hypothetical protein